MRSRIFICFVTMFAVQACGNRDVPEAGSVAEVRDTTSDRPLEDERPRRIYYNLTDYTWYARAEPLLIEQQRYSPSGVPRAIPLAKLRLFGNYQGVDFYALRGEKEPPGTVFVPVHEGYWLPFVAAPSAGD